MTFDKNEHLTVKEAAALVGKSESTIKRFVRENKGNKKYFKHEKLPTGHKKIYISKAFLELSFNSSKSTAKDKSEPLTKESKSTANQQFVDYLLSELEKKNEQLKEKDEKIQSLLDKQMDNVDKLLQLQDQAQKLQAMQNQKQLEEDTTKPKRGIWPFRR